MGTISKWLTQAYQLIFKRTKKRHLYAAHQKGYQGEQIACDYLSARGLLLLERNYHSPWGEIDLIMDDKGTISFIEVRYRTHTTHGTPQETVNRSKQKKMIRTAQHYLKTKRKFGLPCRFDIIGISRATSAQNVEWFKHAIEGIDSK